MIIYLHGFNSAPSSHKARTMGAWMEARGLAAQFVCPALPHVPNEAIRLIETERARHAPAQITLVGSSLGGFYATWVAEKHGLRAVLINPAVRPYAGLQALLGTQKNLYTGDEYQLTREHLAQLQALEAPRIDPGVICCAGNRHEALDWRAARRRRCAHVGSPQKLPEHRHRPFAGMSAR